MASGWLSRCSAGPKLELDWSALWAPYDEPTYQAALAYLRPGETLIDIGAGDLRFARRAAAKGCHVYAVEWQVEIIRRGVVGGEPLPPNLTIILADAQKLPFPTTVETGVLLMRHCEHYALYVEKLRAVGCKHLITNARWRMSVERVPLCLASPFRDDRMGWFACVRCGSIGFLSGDPAELTPEIEQTTVNVEGCPKCCQAKNSDCHRAASGLVSHT